MRIRVSDYIANFLVENDITQVFTVTGGGAMFLNDSFGHHKNISCIYNHHEQASAIAAEGYTKRFGKIAVVCVTSGPGATNAITGVVGAYQDSIPMIIISGQAKSTLCLHTTDINLRSIGGQEVDIVPVVQKNLVNYAEMITDANDILYYLEKAVYMATHGRPGPSWLDIPLDIQGTFVETDDLRCFTPPEETVPVIQQDIIELVIDKIRNAKRPVIYAGNGIRLSHGMDEFKQLVKTLHIPVVTCWDSIDLIDTDNRYYCGRGGNMGDRAGNFAVQNSDLLISIGARLSVYQVGWNLDTWARKAFTIINDIDINELKKPILRVDLSIHGDSKDFMIKLLDYVESNPITEKKEWVAQCNKWKMKYPVVTDIQKKQVKPVNVYNFIDVLSRSLPQLAISVVANGSASVVGSQTYYIKENDRFIMNCSLSSMGYALPAAIGASVGKNKSVVCLEGDGSIMMNLQELQTIVTNQLPIKLFLINNEGYQQIRITQTNIFDSNFVGIGPDSKDLEFPNFKKIAEAFGMPYVSIKSTDDLQDGINKVLTHDGYILCEVFVSKDQFFEPKSATKRLPDGTLFSPPLEDMAPFLSREELKENMYIPVIDEN